jgi:hypothetical protein
MQITYLLFFNKLKNIFVVNKLKGFLIDDDSLEQIGVINFVENFGLPFEQRHHKKM